MTIGNGKSKNTSLFHGQVLCSVLEFLYLCGISDKEMDSLLKVSKRRALQKVLQNSKTMDKFASSEEETVLAVVLHRWHRDRRLLGADAKPKPLPLFGKNPSVEALIKSERPTSSAKALASEMRKLGLLDRSAADLYTPRSRVATIAHLHPILIEHVAKSLMRLLETVTNNVSKRRDGNLIERFTHIPDLSLSDRQSFRRFSQRHGSAFLASVDDWLESRRSKTKRKPQKVVPAGIHVFAYIGKPSSGPT